VNADSYKSNEKKSKFAVQEVRSLEQANRPAELIKSDYADFEAGEKNDYGWVQADFCRRVFFLEKPTPLIRLGYKRGAWASLPK
jgi:hypothetical protein